MRVIEFRVICDYAHNQFQVTTDEHDFTSFNCICESVSKLMLKTFTITRDVRLKSCKAVFSYE